MKLLSHWARIHHAAERQRNQAQYVNPLVRLWRRAVSSVKRLGSRLRESFAGNDSTKARPVQFESMEPRLLLAADLSITSFHSDGQLKVDYDVADQDAGAFDVSVYRSSDGVTLDALVATERIDSAGSLSVGSHSATLDGDFTDVQEDYRLIAVVDSGEENTESDETNNTATFSGGVFQANDGVVHVHGTDAADTVDATEPGDVKVIFNGTLYQYASSSVSAIHIRMHGGDDTVNGGSGLGKSVWAFGASGVDDLTGGKQDDYLDGGDGDDTLKGRQGDDILEGREGHDHLIGDAGGDVLRGAAGNDTLEGNENSDTIDGGDGDDIIKGGIGTDTISGGAGNDDIEGNQSADVIDAGDGDDVVDGGTGADTIYGGAGDDTIDGSQDPDTIYGGDGNDTIDAGYGNDTVYGGEGDDTIVGKAGGDDLYGEGGDDILEGDGGSNTLDGGTGIDTLDGVTDSNSAPTASGIANQSEVEDFAEVSIDLNAAFSDLEHPDHRLTYSVTANTNPTLIASVAVDTEGILTLLPGVNASGVADITVRATDPLGLHAETTFTVAVAAVNDAPTTGSLSTETVDEDAADSTVDLNAVFDDIDNTDAELIYEVVSNSNAALFASIAINAVTGQLTLAYATDKNGQADLTIRATDPGGLWVDHSLTVNITPVNDTPTAQTISDVNVDEDAPATVIDLFAAFEDIDDLDSQLTYTVEGNTNTALFAGSVIDAQTGTLAITHAPDVNGAAVITLRATDSAGLYAETTVTINVAPVQDAPVAAGDTLVTDEDTALTGAAISDASDYVIAVLADDPSVYWRLEEATGTAAANLGNLGSTGGGVYVNNPTLDTDGAFDATNNRAMQLDLSTDRAVTSGAVIPAGTLNDNQYTLEMWFKADSVRHQDLASLTTAAGAFGILLELQDDGAIRYLQRAGADVNIYSSVAYTVGQWHHLAATMDGGNMSLYLDGQLVGSATQPTAVNFDAMLTLGQLSPTNTARQFDGTIDEVALYDHALSSDELKTHRAIALASLLNNDSDADGDALSVTGHDTTSALGAAVVVNADGTFSYDPTGSQVLNALAVGESAADTFDYTISDGNGGLSNATVMIDVAGVNDAPVANHDPTVFQIDIDSLNGGPISTAEGWTSLNATQPSNGDGVTVSIGSVDFAATVFSAVGSRTRADSSGAAEPNDLTGDFVFDTGSGQAVGLVISGLEFGRYQAEVWSWDEHFPAGTQIVGIVTWPAGGGSGSEQIITTSAAPDPDDPISTFEFDADGSSDYGIFTRENNSEDRARFNALRLTLLDEPTTDEDSPIVVDVLANDTDPDATDVHSITGLTGGASGAVITTDGTTVTYDPGAAFEHLGDGESATDTFSYTISDGNGGTATALATVTITGSNDAPVGTIADITVDEDAADTVIDLFAAFSDAEQPVGDLAYELIANTNPSIFAATTLDEVAGTLTLSYAADVSGSSDLVVQVTDSTGAMVASTFTVTVNAVNDGPTSSGIADVNAIQGATATILDLHAAFADVDNDIAGLAYEIVVNTNPTLLVADEIDPVMGTLTLYYDNNASGTSDITVRATDQGGLLAEASFTVVVNAAPQAIGIGNFSVNEDAAPSAFDLSEYFADYETDSTELSYEIVSNSNPSLVGDALDGSQLILGYEADAHGVATLVIRATDSDGLWVEDTLLVEVRSVNDAPQIGTLLDGPDPAIVGADLTLELTQLHDDSISTTVDFYRDLDGNGILDTAVDQHLGADSNAADGYALTTATTGFGEGAQTYFALATDSEGLQSTVASSTGTVGIVGILDDAQPGYSESGAPGSWTLGSGADSFEGSHREALAGDGSATATWAFTGLQEAPHRVFVTWNADSGNATNAPYDVYDGNDLVGSYQVDQQNAPASFFDGTTWWHQLGTFDVENGGLTVVLNNDTDGTVIADAVRVLDPVPTVEYLAGDRAQVIQGTPLLLTAYDVEDKDGTVDQVDFYRDANADGVWDAGDALLGTDAVDGDGWSFSVATESLTTGNNTFFAIAIDNQVNPSDPAAFTATVVAGIETGLVARWGLNDAAGSAVTDAVGTNDGTLVNGSSWTEGLSGGALEFDGFNDYVTFSETIDLTGNEYSIGIWFNTSASGPRDLIALTNASSGSHSLLLELGSDGRLRYLHRSPAGGSGGSDVYSSQAYNDGQWHHATLVKDATTIRLYVDGQEVGSAADSTSLDGAANLVVGRLGTSNIQRVWDGRLDEIRVYDRALVVSEVAQLIDTPANALPEIADAAPTYSVPPGAVDGAALGTVMGSDLNATDSLTYSITEGNDDGAFAIDLTTGEVSLADAALIDFATNPTYTLIVRVADDGSPNLYANAVVTIRPGDLSDGLVNHWQLDDASGDSTDDAVSTNGGTLVNGPTWTNGLSGAGVEFDGVDDYITFPEAIDLVASDYTIGIWFKTDAGGQRDLLALTNTSTGNHGVLLEQQTDGRLRFLHRSPSGTSGGSDIYSAESYNDGQWHQATLIKDASTIFLYVDGQQIGSTGVTTSLDGPTQLVLGRLSAVQSQRYYDGTLDEVRIYNRALTSTEATMLVDVDNAPPTIQDDILAVATDATNGDHVGGVNASDLNPGNTLTYAILAGDSAGAFAINGDGQISVADASALDFVAHPSYALTVEVNDGLATETATITVVGADLNAGLLGHWELDDASGTTLSDTIGTNEGTIAGAQWTSGVEGAGLVFDGANDYVSFPEPIDLTGNEYSIGVWFKTDASGTRDLLSLVNSVSDKHGVLLEQTADARLRFLHRATSASTGGTNIYTSESYNDNKWHQATLVKDANSISLYVDGKNVGSASDTAALDGTMRLTLGRLGPQSARYFAGKLDDLRIYNRAMSALEVTALAHQSPSILGLQAPTAVIEGSELILAADVHDPVGSIQEVRLYRDINGNGSIDEASDTLLATNASGDDGWNFSVDTTLLGIGTHTLFGQAITDAGVKTEVAIAVQVTGDHAIIDTGDNGFTTTGSGWTNGSFGATNAYGDDYLNASAGGAVSTATWTFTDLPDGTFDVYVSYVDAGNHTGDAPYSIYSATPDSSGELPGHKRVGATRYVDQSTVVTVDLSDDSYSWQKIGRATVTEGVLSVELSAGGSGSAVSGWVVADAVRLQRIDQVQGVIDDIDVHVGNISPVPTLIDLASAFASVSNLSGAVTYAVTGNTDPSVIVSADVDNNAATLTVTTETAPGETHITVTATDEYGNQADAVFRVGINDNLVANGSFEQKVLNTGWDYAANDAFVPDWTLEDGPSIELQRGILGGPAEGAQHVELDAHPWPGSSQISQTVSTVDGGGYQLRFAFKARPGTSANHNVLGVEVRNIDDDGNETSIIIPVTFQGTGNWEYHTVEFVATGQQTKILFADEGTPNTYGTFIDDVSLKQLPIVSVSDVGVVEGDIDQFNPPLTTVTFTVSLSAPAPEGGVTVEYFTEDNTANFGADYLPASGTLNFAKGTTSQQVVIDIVGDATVEDTEQFKLKLQNPTGVMIVENEGVATILDDDLRFISIDDVAVIEGASGQITEAIFTVTIDSAPGESIDVYYELNDDTAFREESDFDYGGQPPITFEPDGPTTQQIVVNVFEDGHLEDIEHYHVDLQTSVDGRFVLTDSQGLGTIYDRNLTLTVFDQRFPQREQIVSSDMSGDPVDFLTLPLDPDFTAPIEFFPTYYGNATPVSGVLWQIVTQFPDAPPTVFDEDAGRFSESDNIEWLAIDPDDERVFTLQAGFDVNGDEVLEYSEVMAAVDIRPLDLDRLTVEGINVVAGDDTAVNRLPRNTTPQNPDEESLDFYVSIDDEVTIEFYPTLIGEPSIAMGSMHWVVEAVDANGNLNPNAAPVQGTGEFDDDDVATLNLKHKPANGERITKYLLTTGFDINENGALEESEYWHTTEINLSEIALLELAAANSLLGLNTQYEVVAESQVPADLYVAIKADGTAQIDFEGAFEPDDPLAATEVLWELRGNVAGTIFGDFSINPIVMQTLDTIGGVENFELVAGVDNDDDGVLDPNEISRTIDIHILDVHEMVITGPPIEGNREFSVTEANNDRDLFFGAVELLNSVDGTMGTEIDFEAVFSPIDAGEYVLIDVGGNVRNFKDFNLHDFELEAGTHQVRLGVDTDRDMQFDPVGAHEDLFATIYVIEPDLDIDSDNNNDLEDPDRLAPEDYAEWTLGKQVFDNRGDIDGDGVRDFVDFGGIDPSLFTPVVLELPAELQQSPYTDIKITFSYDGDDPSQYSGPTPPSEPQQTMRVWRLDGTQLRATGDYIEPGVAYSFSQFPGLAPGASVEFYLEALSVDQLTPISVTSPLSQSPAPFNSITVRIDVEGGEEVDGVFSADRVFVTDTRKVIATHDVNDDGTISTEDHIDSEYDAQNILVNSGDRNNNDIRDFAEGYIGGLVTGDELASDHSLSHLFLDVSSFLGADASIVGAYETSELWVRFTYDASDPLQSNVFSANQDVMDALEGTLRLWKSTGSGWVTTSTDESSTEGTSTLRDGQSVNLSSAGDFLPSGEWISFDDLDSARTVIDGLQESYYDLLVEAVNPRFLSGPETIRIEIGVKTENDTEVLDVGVSDTVAFNIIEPEAPIYSDPTSSIGIGDGADGGGAMAASFLGYSRLDSRTASIVLPGISGDPFAWGLPNVNSFRVGDRIASTGAILPELASMPHLVRAGSSVIAVLGDESRIYFDDSAEGYTARFYAEESLLGIGAGGFVTGDAAFDQLIADNPDSYLLTDSAGNQFLFHNIGRSHVGTADGIGSKGDLYDPNAESLGDQIDDEDRVRMAGQLLGVRTVFGQHITYNYSIDLDVLESVDLELGDGESESLVYQYDPESVTTGSPFLTHVQLQRGGVAIRTMEYDGDFVRLLDGDENASVLQTTYHRVSTFETNPDYPDAPVAQSVVVLGPDAFARLAKTESEVSAMDLNDLIDAGAIQISTDGGTIPGGAESNGVDSLGSGAATYSLDTVDLATLPGATHQLGANIDRYKTTVSYRDAAGDLIPRTEVYYLNAARQVLRTEVTTDGLTWVAENRFDREGRLEAASSPSGLTTIYEYFPDDQDDSTNDDGRLKRISLANSFENATTQTVLTDFEYEDEAYGDVVRLSKVTEYAGENETDASETSFTYSGDRGQESRTTTLPVVAVDENGSGELVTITEQFDIHGRLIHLDDEIGQIHTWNYDFADRQLDVTSGGRTDRTTYDSLGRVAGVTEALGTNFARTTSVDYAQTPSHFVTVTSLPDGRKQYDKIDLASGIIAAATVAPDGETLIALTRTHTDRAGRVAYVDRYFDLSGMQFDFGSEAQLLEKMTAATDPGTMVPQAANESVGNFYRENVYYDHEGRAYLTVNAVGTARATEFDHLGRPIASYVGLRSDVTDLANPYGQLTQVSTSEFDEGGVGDSNLSQSTAHVGGGSPDRVTRFAYDWRSQVTATKIGHEGPGENDANRPMTLFDYDNLGRLVETRIFDGDGLSVDDLEPAEERLVSKSKVELDARGQVYEEWVFDANDLSQSRVTSHTYDDLGRLKKTVSPTGLTRSVNYDANGRIDRIAVGDGTIDVLISQRQFDELGRTQVITISELLPTGAGYRVSNTAQYFDDADRITHVVEHGNASGFARSATPPESSDTRPVIRNVYEINEDGTQEYSQFDALGTEQRTKFDPLGRLIQNVRGTSVTRTVYDGVERQLQIESINITPQYTVERVLTEYNYTGPHGDVEISYPGDRTEEYTYNHAGQQTTRVDTNGVVHAYLYDTVGRRVTESLAAIPAHLDRTVVQTDYTFDALGNLASASDDLGSVTRSYDGYGSLEFERSLVEVPDPYTTGSVGLIDVTTENRYLYDDAGRLIQTDHRFVRTNADGTVTAYDDERSVNYQYLNSLDRAMARPTIFAEGTIAGAASLEAYTYLGASTLIGIDRPGSQADRELTLDALGRIDTVTWTSEGVIVDRHEYEYRRTGQVELHNNSTPALATSKVDELFTYNDRGDLLSWTRGWSTAGTIIAANIQESDSWTVDTRGNRYGGRYASGYENGDFSTSDSYFDGGFPNQIALVPQGNNSGHVVPARSIGLRFDALGRLSQVSAQAHTGELHHYYYDALGRRVADLDYEGSTGENAPDPTLISGDALHYEGGRLLRDADGRDYLWSPHGHLVREVAGYWVTHDGQLNTTAILNDAADVLERYLYNVDGLPRAIKPNGSLYGFAEIAGIGASGLDEVTSRYGWNVLYGQRQFAQLLIGDSAQNKAGLAGLYDMGGGQWLNPHSGRTVAPNLGNLQTGANEYNPGEFDVHLALDIVGIVDPTGVADVINAGLYALRGDAINASISIAGAVLPYAGDALKLTRFGAKTIQRATRLADKVSDTLQLDRLAVSRVASTGLHAASGAAVGVGAGVTYGAIFGYIESGSLDGALDGALSGARFGLIQGGIGGAVRGFVNPYICFVAGTQVVVGIGDADDPRSASDTFGTQGDTATAQRVTYRTRAIEDIAVGDLVLALPEGDASGEPMLQRVVEVYCRTADHLRVLTIRDSGGTQQTLETTDDHPFYIVGEGWANASQLVAGDRLREPDGSVSTVVTTTRESHPAGVAVFNFQVEHAHTYFVQAEDSTSEPVWVHNATYTTTSMRDAVNQTNSRGYKKYLDPISNTVKQTRQRLSPDHIFPSRKIEDLPGYDQLSPAQRRVLKSDLANIQALPLRMNISKGSRMASDGTLAAILGRPVSRSYLDQLAKKEAAAKSYLQLRISQMLNEG